MWAFNKLESLLSLRVRGGGLILEVAHHWILLADWLFTIAGVLLLFEFCFFFFVSYDCGHFEGQRVFA